MAGVQEEKGHREAIESPGYFEILRWWKKS